MIIFLCIISYFVVGFIAGIAICKFKGKEWCRANGFDTLWFNNNAEGILYISTFFWVFFILFSPYLIIDYIIKYTTKKLRE